MRQPDDLRTSGASWPFPVHEQGIVALTDYA
ncbi:hypothetical protein R2APBS1_2175 [Rhodanobacter denitrificans]|uniref:Uncharacterized protein n=1 Tax=Rhodanobacter denitrificans TaxID=666685 RepID=M4NGR1_9GAMM|nr:hypothetical protein R2APBS1_2175 [Rhodanobacter denitrificans]